MAFCAKRGNTLSWGDVLKKAVFLCFCLLVAAVFLLLPQVVAEAVSSAVALCGRSLIPSLFPFFVLSNFIIKAGLVPTSPMILGAVGGYPLGASIICDMYREGLISKQAAEGALPYCSLCGAGFIFGAVGGAFGSIKIALIVWAAHILSALVIRIFSPKTVVKPAPSLPFSASFTDGVQRGLFSCLNICAFVIFFSVLLAVLGYFLPISNFLIGVIEMSRGVFSLPRDTFGVVCAAFFTSFGGLCVQAQVASLCFDAGLSPKRHFIGKLLHGALAAVFVLFLTFFIL